MHTYFLYIAFAARTVEFDRFVFELARAFVVETIVARIMRAMEEG